MIFFDDNKEIFSASAPGRLDIMGGIADYSGSLLLQMPVSPTLTVEIQRRNDSLFNLQSIHTSSKIREFQMDYRSIQNKSPGEAGSIIKSLECGDWAAYVIGCFIILNKEKNIPLQGMNIRVTSKIPSGKGVASSAALEVATMNAVCKMFELALTETELPVLAQKVENDVVGAACGLMDQLAVHLGKKNKLLPLICNPHTVSAPVSLPKGLRFFGIDSGIHHAVSGSSYADVRTAAFMAYSVIAFLEGVSADELKKAKQENDFNKLPYAGYLANIPVSYFELYYSSHLPESISGSEFIEKYGISIDNATNVSPEKNYHLLSCARHPVHENARVNLFFQLLCGFPKKSGKEETLRLLGELMLQSHSSYSQVGLGNTATDEIVQKVRKAGFESGLYGARVTGGGSGGTVAVLSYGKEGKQSAKNIYKEYKKKTGKRIFFFTGSNDGALTLNL